MTAHQTAADSLSDSGASNVRRPAHLVSSRVLRRLRMQGAVKPTEKRCRMHNVRGDLMKMPIHVLSTIAALLLTCAQAHGQDARALLDAAIAAMGGQRVQQLDSFVMTGFGQRYNFNGNISADPNSPPKWQAVATSERYFDLRGERALVRERASNMFPFAAPFGMSLDTRERVQTGTALLDHPLSALRAALARPAKLGPVTVEDGMAVVAFELADGSPGWIALDPQTHLPYWARWVNGSTTLGDVTNTSYFTGYMLVDGVQLPTGIMTKIDWRNQATLMFQVDSYRLQVPALPPFPAYAGPSPSRTVPPHRSGSRGWRRGTRSRRRRPSRPRSPGCWSTHTAWSCRAASPRAWTQRSRWRLPGWHGSTVSPACSMWRARPSGSPPTAPGWC